MSRPISDKLIDNHYSLAVVQPFPSYAPAPAPAPYHPPAQPAYHQPEPAYHQPEPVYHQPEPAYHQPQPQISYHQVTSNTASECSQETAGELFAENVVFFNLIQTLPQPAPYVAPTQPAYVEPAPYQVVNVQHCSTLTALNNFIKIILSLVSRPQVTDSHRKPSRHLARSRTA